jgi:nucleoside-diphosphate-sugar epimerase
VNEVLISGASGFAGTNLVKHLSVKGIKSIALVRNPKVGEMGWQSELTFPSEIGTVVHLAGKAHDLKNVTGSDEYFYVNTELTKRLFKAFLNSNAHTFIHLSSVKAIADKVEGNVLSEADSPKPLTPYGESKLAAEKYLLAQTLPVSKKLYILRPCMIHGPGNKGNLNLLYKLVKKGIPWPLGAFENKRSFLSLDNFCIVIDEILNGNLRPGVYNLADSEPLGINEVIGLIAQGMGKKAAIWPIPKTLMRIVAKVGDVFRLPLNSERLQKLTENYVVSNHKLLEALGKPLPVESREGMLKTIKSFEN